MIRTDRYKLVVNPESVNELYDLVQDPDELNNVYELSENRELRAALLGRLYRELRERGDNFYHWMTSMYEVGGVDYDPSQSGFDEESYRAEEALR
jgi:arylsulfatase A-like enzyme